MQVKNRIPAIDVVHEELVEVLRQKTPSERIHMAAEANETARIISAAGIRFQHPDWSDERVQQEVAWRMLSATA